MTPFLTIELISWSFLVVLWWVSRTYNKKKSLIIKFPFQLTGICPWELTTRKKKRCRSRGGILSSLKWGYVDWNYRLWMRDNFLRSRELDLLILSLLLLLFLFHSVRLASRWLQSVGAQRQSNCMDDDEDSVRAGNYIFAHYPLSL